MGSAISAITDPFTDFVNIIRDIAGAFLNIAETIFENFEEIVNLLFSLVKIGLKIVNVGMRVFSKMLPLIEGLIYIAPLAFMLFGTLTALSQFKDVDIGAFNKFKPLLNKLVIACSSIVTYLIYDTSIGLGWQDLWPNFDSIDISAFDVDEIKLAKYNKTDISTMDPIKVDNVNSISSIGLLVRGVKIWSEGGRYYMTFQDDGNLVLYDGLLGKKALWDSGTPGRGEYAIFDGALEIYNASDKRIWVSNDPAKGARLTIQSDGNAVVYSKNDNVLWASNTVQKAPDVGQKTATYTDFLPEGSYSRGLTLNSLNGRYRMAFQPDGNLVVYDGNKPIWASGTADATLKNPFLATKDPIILAVQSDGNLVLYDKNNKPVWATNKNNGDRPIRLRMQNDSNLVMYNSSMQPIWSSLHG